MMVKICELISSSLDLIHIIKRKVGNWDVET